MSFTEAIRSVLNQYVGFSGRARRSEYWYWILFYLIVSIITSILDRALFGGSSSRAFITGIVGLAFLLPNLAVAVRRLHDTSRSGWWILIGLIPVIGSIVLLIFYIQDSHGDNQYGPSPKAVGSAPGSTPGSAPSSA